jgi:hypothetical protein
LVGCGSVCSFSLRNRAMIREAEVPF